MFVDMGGTFTGTHNANRVYYLYEDEIHTTPFDLSSLELPTGTHTIQVKARAQGHEDSEFSNSVSYYATTPIIH